MSVFRIDTHGKSGTVTLWMEAPCGFIPIIGWESMNGVKEFANMLLEFCNHMEEKRDRAEDIWDRLLRETLGDKEYLDGGSE